MAQVQAYQGYFKNGQFISSSEVKLPENVEVFITISGRSMPQEEKLNEEQRAVVIKVIENLEKINKEPIDEETQAHFDAFDRGEFKVTFPDRLSDDVKKDFSEVQA